VKKTKDVAALWQKIKLNHQKNGFLLYPLSFLLMITGLWQAVFYEYYRLPHEQIVIGEQLPENLLAEEGLVRASVTETKTSANSDIYQVDYSLMGLIPLASTQYNVIEPFSLMVGGHSIGVLLHTDGSTVIGYAPVQTKDGGKVYPAKEAGVLPGDFIVAVNGKAVENDTQVAELFDEAGSSGQKVEVSIERDGQPMELKITPAWCTDSHSWRVGLYIRDSTAGVGTLTFYDPKTGQYGALGHIVSDLNKKMTDDANKGSIVAASVQGINKGQIGLPGEKKGAFIEHGLKGTIEKNCYLGIFGHLQNTPDDNIFTNALPVASAGEIEQGPAQIVTVLSGEKLQVFDVKIVRIFAQQRPTGKGLIIEVTDPALLNATGGIVQGMSGSPVIQNGKIVGAVTHVFINNPTKGYGCLAEWMVWELQK